ncbi:terminase large subunit domain-containing protein [Terricaulis sp.]|uniref:phage terminase large subunit family protein n=1 Tax=Terricaulis sp. TaxID=2768686 RepID=UPI003784E950
MDTFADEETPPRKRGGRVHLAPSQWRQMQRDYEDSDALVAAIAENYGISLHALAKHAQRYGWRKPRVAAPALLAPPDPAQVIVDDEGGVVSAWESIAHAAQRPPPALDDGGPWSTWLFQGGRGAGKTRAGAEWLAARAEATPGGVFALIGPTMHDLREVMIEGVSGLRNLPGRERPFYEHVRKRLSWKNGAAAYAFSAEEPERLRGPQFEAAWADEFCIWPKPTQTLANLRLALRRGRAPQLVITTTPKPIAAFRALRGEPGCVITQAETAINAAHLAPTFLSGLDRLYGGTRLASQEIGGLLVDGEGALFRAEDLARARAASAGARPAVLEQVVVGVDPPAGAGGAACGIVVAARAGGRYFVLADESAAGLSPLGWASRVVEAAARFGAHAIVAEANQGGDMVRATLAQAGAACAIRLVHARHNKRARAEPVAALYEQGRVSHCGAFAALEEELMALGAADGEGLLDRADALVWAVTALSEGGAGPRLRVL